MVLAELVYFPILGVPLLVLLGFLALIFILAAAVVSILNKKGKTRISFKWHPRLAHIAIIIALIHAAMAILIYI
jgi:hypothetical protein